MSVSQDMNIFDIMYCHWEWNGEVLWSRVLEKLIVSQLVKKLWIQIYKDH